MSVHRIRSRVGVRVRRVVALLAIAAWLLGTLVCPDVSAADAATHHDLSGAHHHGAASGKLDFDPSCQVLAHAGATLPAIAAEPAGGGLAHILYLLAPSVPRTEPDAALRVDEAESFHGPPRTSGLRFVIFWPHAPPAAL